MNLTSATVNLSLTNAARFEKLNKLLRPRIARDTRNLPQRLDLLGAFAGKLNARPRRHAKGAVDVPCPESPDRIDEGSLHINRSDLLWVESIEIELRLTNIAHACSVMYRAEGIAFT